MILLDTHLWFWFINQIEEDATLATLDSLVRSYPEMRHHLLSP